MCRSIEQICRDLLEIAIHDRLVRMEPASSFGSLDPHPQARTAGDLARMANELQGWLEDCGWLAPQ